MPEILMSAFYEKARRLDALRRIEEKRQRLATPPEEEEEMAVVKPRVMPPKGKKKCQQVKPKVTQPKKAKECKPLSPQSRISRQVQKHCDICGTTFSVQASYVNRKHTCGNPNCSSLKRSLSLRKNERWFTPKTCEGIDCCNFLDPCRQRSRQSRFCSVPCSKNAETNSLNGTSVSLPPA